jgi:uncharacterized protein (DUF362 family)
MLGMSSRIYIGHLGEDYLSVVREAFTWLGLESRLMHGGKVCIKPNLTFPTFRAGVMTNPKALEAVVVCLKDYTNNITICESDGGGYNRFPMDEVFVRTGISEFAKEYDIAVVNMSHVPSRAISVRCGFRRMTVPLPTFLVDESDLFITMPVPKVHCNAVVSVALKNQWGVIQDPSQRLKLHPYFAEVIYAINKALPRTIAVVDGKYGLTRNGPMRGKAVELNWILAGDNVFCVDRVVTELMGINYRDVPYLNRILTAERMDSLADVEFNADFRQFGKERFFLKREWTDYPGVLTFNSRFLAYVGYESVAARPLHWLLYKFREPFY